MNGRRAIIGLCMLCALMFSAVAAQSAAAKGTTAFTCKKKSPEGGVGFSKEHCKRADAVSTGAKFEHVAIANGTVTELEGTNAKTNSETNGAEPFFLTVTIGGIPVELKATTVSRSGAASMSNSEVEGQMITSGSGTLLFSGVTITKPAGQGCVVTGGTVTTKKLKATTAGQPAPEEESNAEMFVKFEPFEGTTFFEIPISGCETTALNGTFKATGTIKGRPDGATIVFTKADTEKQATLKFAGQTATIEGKLTESAKLSTDTAFTPLSVTTK